MSIFGKILLIAGMLLGIVLSVFAISWNIAFETGCSGHMERASNANTVEMAISEMKMVIDYAEKHDLTSGTTKIFFNYPQYDIGFWYQNMKASLGELTSLKKNAAPLERSNMLLKLRETLTSQGDGKEKLIVPSGISMFPYNVLMFWLSMTGISMMILGFLFLTEFLTRMF